MTATASGDQTARVWDAESGELLHTLEGHTGEVFHAAYSPDGTRLVTTSGYQTARIYTFAVEELVDLARKRLPVKVSAVPVKKAR